MEYETDALNLYDQAESVVTSSGKSKCNKNAATFEDFIQKTINQSSDPMKKPGKRTSIREVSHNLSYPTSANAFERPEMLSRLKNDNLTGMYKQKRYAEKLTNDLMSGSPCPCPEENEPFMTRKSKVNFMSGSTEYDVGARTHITVGNRPHGLCQERIKDESKILGTSVGDNNNEKRTCFSRGSKKPSCLQEFDMAVTTELNKRRMEPTRRGVRFMNQSIASGFLHDPTQELTITRPIPISLKSTVSAVGIEQLLRDVPDEELLAAIDAINQADAACIFEGSVMAAEEAAARAPPELAEEAAAAASRSYRAQLLEVVKDVVHGDDAMPIEVLGYIGITKPT